MNFMVWISGLIISNFLFILLWIGSGQDGATQQYPLRILELLRICGQSRKAKAKAKAKAKHPEKSLPKNDMSVMTVPTCVDMYDERVAVLQCVDMHCEVDADPVPRYRHSQIGKYRSEIERSFPVHRVVRSSQSFSVILGDESLSQYSETRI